jgi:hypothetical protein
MWASIVSSPWAFVSAVVGMAVLGIAVWINFVRPARRRRALERPAKTYFHIQEIQLGDIGYAIQDDHAHNVAELVLPSNWVGNIEVVYLPTVHFNQKEIIFITEGPADDKPRAFERYQPFVKVGKNHYAPGEDQSDYIDRKDNYHVRVDVARDVGSNYVLGLRLATRTPGVYKVIISWMTDEIEGNAELSIRVEDRPTTRMRCTEHPNCWISPRPLPSPPAETS